MTLRMFGGPLDGREFDDLHGIADWQHGRTYLIRDEQGRPFITATFIERGDPEHKEP